MMVSVALFAVVISVALPTMLVVVKASARAQALQTTIDNTSFAIDAMSRQVRLGKNYRCTNDSITATQWEQTTNNPYASTLDCTGGASTLIFTDQYNKRQAYRYNSASSTLENWNTDADTWISITAPKVLIKSAVFTVTGSAMYDGVPPIVGLALRGASQDEASVPEFTLSTNMTQYVPERGFAIRRLGQGAANLTLTAGAHFGSGVTSVGDIDGDNVTDLLVGMETYASNAGGAQVLLMNANGTVKASKLLTSGANGMLAFGSGELVGSGVAFVGDIDGDGAPEVVLGAPRYASNTGAMHIATLQIDGTATSAVRYESEVNGMPTLASGGYFGASVANIGSRKIAVSAPFDDTACVDCGAIYILSFNSDKSIKATPTKIAAGLGLSSGDGFGFFGIAFLGYDTIGQRIIAVGANKTSCVGGAGCGAVYILHLTNTDSVASYTKLSSDTNGMPVLAATSWFGASVTAGGDLDGDGVADIIVGAEENTGTGSLYILFMNANDTVKESRRITNTMNGGPVLDIGDRFGRSVANIGDLNGDRRTDFVVGAHFDDGANNAITNAGALYILFGK